MTENPPNELNTDSAEIEAIEARLVAVQERLAILMQMIADGMPLGGALVGLHGPWSADAALRFASLVKGHDGASGSLWDAIRAAGFEVVELPESLYGALTPDSR